MFSMEMGWALDHPVLDIAEFMMNTDSCPLVANWSVYVPESIFR